MSERNECVAFEEDLSAWVDGELDAAHGERVRAHVESCAACNARVAVLRAVDAELRDVADVARASDGARLSIVRRNLEAALHDDTSERPAALRAPRRHRRWIAPLASGLLGAAAAAAFVLLLRAPEPTSEIAVERRVDRAVATREPSAPIAAPEVSVAAQQQRDEAFAGSGASASVEHGEASPSTAAANAADLEIDSADELQMIERMATLSDAERAELERDVARWRGMSDGQRDAVRQRWRDLSD